MKPLSLIEQVGLVLSLAVVAAMLTQCATPAHATENQQSSKPNKTLLSIENNGYAAGGAFAYPARTHPHDGFGLVANDHLAHMPRFNAAFLCVSFSTSVMVRLDGEAFAPASFLSDLSTNLIQSNRLHLVVNDSTSINHLEVNYHD